MKVFWVMDDKGFDDIIRKKATGFVDTGHDAHALTDLRKRLSNLPGKQNGWTSGKTAYAVGAMVLFTLINFSIIWYFSEARHATLNKELDQLKNQRNQFVAIQDELTELRAIKTDTVYIYRNMISSEPAAAFGFSHNTGQVKDRKDLASDPAHHTSRQDQHFSSMTENQHLSDELRSFLSENNLLLSTDQGELVLVVSNTPTPVYPKYSSEHNSAEKPGAPRYLSEVDIYDEPQLKQALPEKKKMPNRMLWALEKHQHKGIDWQFGLEGIYHTSNFDVGTGEWNGGVGFLTEAILSPVWRIETGISVGARSYKIKETEIQGLPAEFFDDYPGYDDQLGELISIESEAYLVKVPLNLKYFSILDHNKKWYVGVGITPQWSTEQELEYKYELDVANPPVGDTEYTSFVGSKQEISSAYYTTTLNLGAGTEVYLNDGLRWQFGLFYQKGLSKAGVENRKLESSYGIKTSVWFNKP